MRKVFIFILLAWSVCLTAEAQRQWVKHPENPLIPPYQSYSMDPTVIFDESENTYKMWFTVMHNGMYNIHYMTSQDGIHWPDFPGIQVLSPGQSGSWDDQHVRAGSIVYDGQIYRLYYDGMPSNSSHEIGVALSTDGITWEKYEGNPILTNDPELYWESSYICFPKVIYHDSTFWMVYSAYDSEIRSRACIATSEDGLNWAKNQTNPVLDLGGPGEWDNWRILARGGFIHHNGKFYLLYQARGYEYPNAGYGLAYSLNGTDWEKYTDNPVMEVGPPGSWDEISLGAGSMRYINEKLRLWYAARTSVSPYIFQIGFATESLDVVSIDENASVSGISIADFKLHQNYPNPFNPMTTIRYEIPTVCHVKLSIYNTAGQRVDRLVNQEVGAGLHHVDWAGNVASGVYFYKLEAKPLQKSLPKIVVQKRMILMK